MGFGSYARRVRVQMTIIAILAKLLVLPLYAGMWFAFYFVAMEMGAPHWLAVTLGVGFTLPLLLEDNMPNRILKTPLRRYWNATVRPVPPRRLP